ncbi:magnesium transporter [Nitrosomonas sp. Is37]|uniref:magnesium transporter n=1 Tax=Nitrosomonas sp. Is37 TaxID=3080535 RepID=UPI0039829005
MSVVGLKDQKEIAKITISQKPHAQIKMGRDPAIGSSVMITAVTDSGGFFIFLGLATLFLL